MTNDGLRLRGTAGEEFRPWSSFSKMESAGELIMFYGQGDQRNLPIVILNIHWCTSSADQDRLWSLLEARFGNAATETRYVPPAKSFAPQLAPPRPETVGDESIVISGLVGLDQLLRIQQLKRQPQIVKFVSIVVVLVIILGGMIHWWSEPRPGKWAEYGFQVAVLGLFYVLGLFKRQLDAWLLRRSHASGRTRPQWMTWTISASGVSMLTEAFESHESWSQLKFLGEAEDMLVLFNPTSYRFHFLPREFATEEQWEVLRGIVRDNAVRS